MPFHHSLRYRYNDLIHNVTYAMCMSVNFIANLFYLYHDCFQYNIVTYVTTYMICKSKFRLLIIFLFYEKIVYQTHISKSTGLAEEFFMIFAKQIFQADIL